MNTTFISRRKVLTPAQIEKARAICKNCGNKPIYGWVVMPTLLEITGDSPRAGNQFWTLRHHPVGRRQTCPDPAHLAF
jgi:hypothetical protein